MEQRIEKSDRLRNDRFVSNASEGKADPRVLRG
jgi:hypothetical protein